MHGMADKLRPPEVVNKHFPEVHARLMHMRGAVAEAGPLDAKTRELLLLAAFTVGRQAGGVKTHTRLALGHGATPEEIRQAIVVTFGASASIGQVGEALIWADEVIDARQS
jgi:4-carboxymuconolactone decarboxylase